MCLYVQWINSSRPHEVVTQVEQTYRDNLLEFFGSPQKAERSKQHYFSSHHRPFSDWLRANEIAKQEATKRLTEKERQEFEASICFQY